MKPRIACFVMVGAYAITMPLFLIIPDLLPRHMDATVYRMFFVGDLLFFSSFLVCCISFCCSDSFTRFERTSSLILGITLLVRFIIDNPALTVLGYIFTEDPVENAQRLEAAAAWHFFALWNWMTYYFPRAFFFSCFAFRQSWGKWLRITAGILAVLCMLASCPYVVSDWSIFIIQPCTLLFFVLLATSPPLSTSSDTPHETSHSALVHSKIRFVLFSFKGRISRSMYWLQVFPVLFACSYISHLCEFCYNNFIIVKVIPAMLSLLSFWPALAGMVKRMHDRDYSAKWCFTLLIPFVNLITGVWIIFTVWFLKGTEGTNRFGPDPLHPSVDGMSIDISHDSEKP